MKKVNVLFATLGVALVVASSAMADSLTDSYGGKAGAVQATVKGAVAKVSPATTKGSGTLPFTGLDLTLIVAGAVVLLVAGFGVRRAARDKS